MTRTNVVVTGVSTGIGLGIARVLVGHGAHVFGSVRAARDGQRLRGAFGDQFTPLLFDITEPAAVRDAAASVRAALDGHTLHGLVNNAGIATFGPLLYQPVEEVRRQMDVNLLGAVSVTQAFAPLLGVDRTLSGARGRIINISSVAGKLAAPFLGAYAASKHALEGLSDSLRRELLLYGIDVVIVEPGAVATPIWDKGEEAGTAAYDATDFGPALRQFGAYMIAQGRKGLPPEHIGHVVWKALTARRPRARYAVLHGRLLSWTLPLLLPARTVDRQLGRRLGLRPAKAGWSAPTVAAPPPTMS
jgi:NAD(P)-dependent dehydrogenase (short-subunit alcohol dehydrogenase family)